ncbi:isoprenyl transferase [bacterium]|nr:isoprenyl transferase [bacterium]
MDIKKIVKDCNLSHIAIIMDGNRRWAKQRFLPTLMGHKKGVEALKTTVRACLDFGVKYLTVYAFSTENWNRKKEEVDYLMNLIKHTLEVELDELYENNVKMTYIGKRDELSDELQQVLLNSENKTNDNNGVYLNIALNYGARDEIINAVNNLLKTDKKEITQEDFSKMLYTSSFPDPDLLIRTSGEYRISNFLLWQIAYSELYITDVFWPDFNKDELKKAIEEFSKRKRRWGK